MFSQPNSAGHSETCNPSHAFGGAPVSTAGLGPVSGDLGQVCEDSSTLRIVFAKSDWSSLLGEIPATYVTTAYLLGSQ